MGTCVDSMTLLLTSPFSKIRLLWLGLTGTTAQLLKIYPIFLLLFIIYIHVHMSHSWNHWLFLTNQFGFLPNWSRNSEIWPGLQSEGDVTIGHWMLRLLQVSNHIGKIFLSFHVNSINNIKISCWFFKNTHTSYLKFDIFLCLPENRHFSISFISYLRYRIVTHAGFQGPHSRDPVFTSPRWGPRGWTLTIKSTVSCN